MENPCQADGPRRSGRERKRVIEDELPSGVRAKNAAIEYLKSKRSRTIRAVALAHGVLHHTHVHHWLSKWKGSDLEAALLAGEVDIAEEDPKGPDVSLEPRPEPANSCPSPVEVPCTSKHKLRQHMAREAAAMVKKGKAMTIRRATDLVMEKYKHYNVSLSHMTVQNYMDENYDPSPTGKASYLPTEFTDRLARWIQAMRALKFPLFKESVIASANNALEGTIYLQRFKHQTLDKDWYYRFLRSYSHMLGTENQRPIEVTRAKWATAKNIGEWYEMLADALVDNKVAVRNPKYDPNAPFGSPDSEPIYITAPDRIISFDETRIELDMTQASKAKGERTLVDKTAPQSTRNETLANKGGLCGTGVGGSSTSGKAFLPALFILASGSLDPSWCSPAPLSDFLDEDGAKIPAQFTCNQKGGVRDCIGVQYLSNIIAPLFPDLTADKPIVLICDGHGSHLTLELLEYCRAHHIVIVLRVPHTTHLTQGEDVRNFRKFKSLLRKSKHHQLGMNFARGIYNLRNSDFMRVIEQPWLCAFSKEENLKGWSECGLSPFNRRVYHELKREEDRTASVAARNTDINYEMLSLTWSGPQDDQTPEERDADLLTGRISSADLYSMGPVTCDRAFHILKQRQERKEKETQEKNERMTARARKASEKGVQLLAIFNSLDITTQADIKKLKKDELQAVLHCKDNARKKEHKALKKMDAMRAYILALPEFATLPVGEQAAARPKQGRPRQARPEDESDTSEDEDGDEETGDSESEAAETYNIDHFVDVCKWGRSYKLLVRWEGFSSAEDTWEPITVLRMTQNDRVEAFVQERKAAGTWP